MAQQNPPPAGPNSLRERCQLAQHTRQPWPFFWARIPNARLVGGNLVLVDEQKRLVEESAFGQPYAKIDPSNNYLWLPEPIRLEGPWTSTRSHWCPYKCAYYHWFMDALPRLALLDQFPTETRLIAPDIRSGFRRESLEILGLLDRCRPTPEQHVIVEDYYFSSPPAMTGCDNPYAVNFLRDRFLSTSRPASVMPEKIYIVRTDLRTALNGDELLEFLQARGFTPILAEKFSLREQIAMFANARAVCGIHGAGFTNTLWCRPGTKVIELCPANYLNGCYESLTAQIGLDYHYLVSEADREIRIRVDLKALGACLNSLDL